jgi:SAM-dependent methyltransferase
MPSSSIAIRVSSSAFMTPSARARLAGGPPGGLSTRGDSTASRCGLGRRCRAWGVGGLESRLVLASIGVGLYCGPVSDETPPFFEHLPGVFAVMLLQVGRRTGLLDTVLAEGGTAQDIATRAGVDERNAQEWLRGMSAAGYLAHTGGRFEATPTTRTTFGPQFPVDVASILDGLWGATQVQEDVVTAVKSGSGISAERLAHYAPFAGVNTPMYEMALVEDWVAAVPGLRETLERGARVAEIAAGTGNAAAVLGRAFPNSAVVGYDLNPQPLPDLPGNVSLLAADARDLAGEGPFDLVYCLDALHHMSDPVTILERIHAALGPGGVVLVAENDLSGDLNEDASNPGALIAYASSVIYCLQEPLAQGGEVHSGAEGPQWVIDALERAGYQDVGVHHSDTGYAIIHGIA